MELVRDTFNDRLNEIEIYFDFINHIEQAMIEGGACFKAGKGEYKLSPEQQKIMYSSIYLHLYNLVESTMAQLIDAVERHTTDKTGKDMKKLTDKMRNLFIKHKTEPHLHLNFQNRLDREIGLLNIAIGLDEFSMKIPPGGGGNWDASDICEFSQSLGININIPKALESKLKRHIIDNMGSIRAVKVLRNQLAHGNISFAECGERLRAKDFRTLIDVVRDYLSVVINAYDEFIKNEEFKIKDALAVTGD